MSIVDAGVRKDLELSVVVPVEDMGRLGEIIPLEESPGGPMQGPETRTSIWPSNPDISRIASRGLWIPS